MDESKLAKIEALIKKAESTKFQEEAETYYAKAQELMAKWSIDEAMLRANRKGDRGKPIMKTITLNKSGLWRSNLTLITCLARPNDVKIVYTEPYGKGSKPKVHLIGFEEDVTSVEMLYMSMLVQNTRMRRQMMPEHLTSQTDKVPWLRGFIEGFAFRISERLTEMKQSAEREAAVQYGESSLLPVLASKAQVVADAMGEFFPHTKAGKGSRQKSSWEGASAGRKAADRADIGQKRMGATPEIGR